MIELFGLNLSLYGAIVGICVAFIINRFLDEFENKIKLIDYIFVLISCLLLGRLFYAIRNPEIFSKFLAIHTGGTRIYGVLAGLFLSSAIVARYRNLKFLRVADNLALTLPLAQGVGRFANFINQELYGFPSELPWAVHIRPENRIRGYETFSHFHPVFFYEAALNFVLWIIISRLKSARPGIRFAFYLIGYGVIRIITNRFRLDLLPNMILDPSDLISAIFILIGIVLLKRLTASNESVNKKASYKNA
ncbi:hypothetical protein GF357_01540 [Candidatus Dojkabacteria bacterium]|nr:hypothetical protein [Candidatus Dojkabacteria bacterium]